MSALLDSPGELRIRLSGPGDRAALARLAQVDGAPPPVGHHLLAEEDGVLRAALPLGGARVLADPFHRTAEIVAILEVRAAGLEPVRRPAPRPARRAPRRSLRAAPAKA